MVVDILMLWVLVGQRARNLRLVLLMGVLRGGDLLLWLRLVLVLLLQLLLEMPLAHHGMFCHCGLSQTVDSRMNGRNVSSWIGTDRIQSVYGESPVLVLVVRVGPRVKVIVQVVRWEIHGALLSKALSERRPRDGEAQHTRIDRSREFSDGR